MDLRTCGIFELLEDRYYDIDDIDGIIENCFTHCYTRYKDSEVFEDVLAFDIETSSFEYGKDDEEVSFFDEDLYALLKNTILKYNDSVKNDIPDFEHKRILYLSILTLSKKKGIPIDSFYQELSTIYPNYFPADIYNTSDQLEKIFEVIDIIRPKYDDDADKCAIMYVWQLAINGRVIIGRTWEDFIYVLEKISEHHHLHSKRKMIIYVHNLAFEFQFMRTYFNWVKVFATAPRKPLFALCDLGFEFRCSYILSNYSLAKVGENLQRYKVKKLVGDLDYSQIRTPNTLLTDKEIGYCINDVLVVSAYIKEEIENEGSITKIPYTCTGYCRNYCRKQCLSAKGKKARDIQFRKYHGLMRKLTLTVSEYQQLHRAFAGGFTHCSARFSGITVQNVDSFDFTSSYPAVLLSEQYPMSKAELVHISSLDELLHNIKLYCCVFDIEFYGLEPLMINENYIAKSKCYNIEGCIENNGRVVSCEHCGITITDIDFNIIRKCYHWRSMKIGEFRRYKRGYLPKEIIMAILTLYKDKTMLKGVKGKEIEYLRSKGLLNSIYGMMVTNIMQELNEYIDDVWTCEKPDAEKAIEKYNHSKRRFLYFPWGIFCTAYARANLWFGGILPFGDDYIYSDTDSIKCLNAEKHLDAITDYNKNIINKLHAMCDHYGIDYDLLAPKTIKGEAKMIGIWDWESKGHQYKYFRSIGSKRYMIYNDEGLNITVSGINKFVCVPYLIEKYGIEGAFKEFDQDLHIPGDYTGKLTHYYIDEPRSGTIVDYQGTEFDFYAPTGIYLEKAEYYFDIKPEYLLYLEKLKGRYICDIMG